MHAAQGSVLATSNSSLTLSIAAGVPSTQQGRPSQKLDFGAQYTAWSFRFERFETWVAQYSVSLEAKAISWILPLARNRAAKATETGASSCFVLCTPTALHIKAQGRERQRAHHGSGPAKGVLHRRCFKLEEVRCNGTSRCRPEKNPGVATRGDPDWMFVPIIAINPASILD